MNDTQEEFAHGEVVHVDEKSPAWARVRLDGGRCVFALDPGLSRPRDRQSTGEMLPGDRVCILLLEGYCLIMENECLAARRSGPDTPRS